MPNERQRRFRRLSQSAAALIRENRRNRRFRAVSAPNADFADYRRATNSVSRHPDSSARRTRFESPGKLNHRAKINLPQQVFVTDSGSKLPGIRPP